MDLFILKKWGIGIVLVILMCIITCQPALSASEVAFRPKLACVPFLATSIQAMSLTENISSTLLNSLDGYRRFEIMERKKIEHFIELEGARLDNLTQQNLINIGTKAGIDFMLYGSVGTTSGETSIEIKVLNARSGKILLDEVFRVSETDFSNKISEIASTVLDRILDKSKKDLATQEPAKPLANMAQPASLTVSSSATSITLLWNHNDSASLSGFSVLRGLSPDGPFVNHATTTEPSFVDQGLRLNETFYYRIAAIGRDGRQSEFTPCIKGSTTEAPHAPIFLNIQPDIKGATLTWMPRPSDGKSPAAVPAIFRIYRKLGENGAMTLAGTVGTEQNTFQEKGLKDNQKYIFAITAVNATGGESEFSAKLAVVPLGSPENMTAVSGLIKKVTLTWSIYKNEMVTGYIIYRSKSPSDGFVPIAKIASRSTLSYIDEEKLEDNTEYWYRISASKSDSTETDMTAPVAARTRDVPTPPSPVQATSGEPRRVTITWGLPWKLEDEVQKVVIFRADESGKQFEKIEELSFNAGRYSDTSPPLKDKTKYRYFLKAVNSGGAVSFQSQIAEAITKKPPDPPQKVSATNGDVKKNILNWTSNKENDVIEYQIFRKGPSESAYKKIKSVSANLYEDTELKDGSDYYYYIIAVDKDDIGSSASDVVVGTTRPLPLKISGVSVIDRQTRKFSWTMPSANSRITSYNIYEKGFLGVPSKIASTNENFFKLEKLTGKIEVFVTAVDAFALESEPSEILFFE